MKLMKKWISILLCVLLICAAVPISAVSVGAAVMSGNCGVNGDNVTWTFDSSTGVFTLSGSGEMVDYQSASASVTYNLRRQITSIVIEDGITNIGGYMFYDCIYITDVLIPNSITRIGYEAFYACSGIQSVQFSNRLTSIGDWAFAQINRLKSFTLPNSVTQVGQYAFSSCDNLIECHFGSGVTQIKTGTLQYCNKLESVTFSKNVTSIASGSIPSNAEVYYDGNYTQFQVLGLSNSNVHYQIAGGITGQVRWGVYDSGLYLLRIYGNGTMGNAEAEYDDGDWYIESPWEDWMSVITKVNIGYGVTHIGTYVFAELTRLTEVSFSDSIKTVGSNAFSGSDNISRVNIPDIKVWCGINFISSPLRLTTDLYAKNASGNYRLVTEIPSSVTVINNLVFYNYKNLIYATIPDGVKRIGDGAFQNCPNITSITIPGSVTSIGNDAFRNCDKLTGATVPDTVTSLGNHAFYDCDKLATVNVGSGVTKIKDSTFYSCAELSSVTLNGEINAIEQNSFAYCPQLQSFSVPDSVTEIGNDAFRGDTLLSDLSLGNALVSIGEYAFSYCTNLNQVTFPNSLQTIGARAFIGCSALSSLTFGNCSPTIGIYAFSSCPNLSRVNISSIAAWCSVNYLMNTTINSGSTPLTTAKNLYYNGELLTHLVIPDGVTKINKYAFMDCTSIESAVIPESVETIGSCAFYNCANLEWIHVKNPNCVLTDSNLFSQTTHICCEPGSTAETYAVSNRNPYGHLWSDWETLNPADCINVGQKKHTCSICGEIETGEISALGHDWVEDLNLPASCTEEGFIINICSRCHEEEEICPPPLGHDLGEWTTTRAATCTEDGEEQRACSRCDYVETRAITALGHDYDSVETPATCTEGGYTTHTCSRCQDTYTDSLTNALGHDFGEWTTTNAATCTEDGEEHRDCSRCDYMETRVIEALGHDYDSVVTPATCTEGGYTTHTCSRCQDTYTDSETNALGHDYTVTVRRAPTATSQGAIKYECSRCGDSGNKAIPKLSENDYTLTNNTATCTEAGTATYTWKNTSYGICSFNAATDALGHDYVLAPIDGEHHHNVCSHCGDEQESQAHAFENGVCACGYAEDGYVEDPALKGDFRSISLRSDLSINYYISDETLNQYTDPYLECRKAIYDEDGNITGYEEKVLRVDRSAEYEGKTYSGFTFPGVTAKEFSSVVSATFCGTKDGILHKGETTEYSVKAYAMEQLARTDDENLSKLLVDLLNYGAAAQTFFKSNLAHLANAELTAEQKTVATVTAEMINKPYDRDSTVPLSGVAFSQVTLSLRSEITLSLYFKSDSTLSFSCDKNKDVEKEKVTINGIEYQVARIRGITSKEIGSDFTLTFSDGENSGHVTYSPMTYCYNVLDRGTNEENLPEVVKALYCYWKSAETYFV